MRFVFVGILIVMGVLFANKLVINANEDLRHKVVAASITQLLEKTHFSHVKVNDDISKKLYDKYFSVLDNNKMYFLQEDIDSFKEKYFLTLDDNLKQGDLTFAKEVHKVFLKRFKERQEYFNFLIKQKYDFTKKEERIVDREDAAFAKNKAELNEIWRKIVKGDILTSMIAKMKDEKLTKLTDAQIVKITDKIKLKYEAFNRLIANQDEEDIVERYLSSFTHLFDPHSSYMNHRSQESFRIDMNLSLEGIGATLQTDDAYTKIISLVPGGPAQLGGDLKVGDKIISVSQDGKKYESLLYVPINKAVSYIRGKKGTKVYLKVFQKEGDVPRTIVITRDKVQLKESGARGELKEIKLDDKTIKVAYVYLPSFYKENKKGGRACSVDVKKEIEKLLKQGATSILIDLRGNGGGDLFEAIKMSGLFIPKGPMVQVKTISNEIYTGDDDDKGFYFSQPLTVLVDKTSASASEIFAGAIQDYGRGVVVGNSSTHGKGTVQSIRPLDNIKKGGLIKYTTAKFYRISGGSTQLKGVIPDVVLPSFYDAMETGEVELEGALKWDEINKSNYKEYDRSFDDKLKKIIANSKKRIKENKIYQQRIKDIKDYKKFLDKETISLNLEDRLKSLKQNERFGDLVSNSLMPFLVKSEVEKEEDKNLDTTDYDLEEALNILGELVLLEK